MKTTDVGNVGSALYTEMVNGKLVVKTRFDLYIPSDGELVHNINTIVEAEANEIVAILPVSDKGKFTFKLHPVFIVSGEKYDPCVCLGSVFGNVLKIPAKSVVGQIVSIAANTLVSVDGTKKQR